MRAAHLSITSMALDPLISRRSIFSALGLIPALRVVRGQDKDQPTFSTGVKVVNLFANVRNKSGAIVKDLTKDDFLLSEDDRAQVIRYFSQESDLPLTLGLLVDTSGSQRRLIDEERAASYRFFEQVLRPEKDVAFVIHFDFDMELLQDITPSRRLLEKALEELEAPTGQRQQRRQSGGSRERQFRSRFRAAADAGGDAAGAAAGRAAADGAAAARCSTTPSCWRPTN